MGKRSSLQAASKVNAVRIIDTIRATEDRSITLSCGRPVEKASLRIYHAAQKYFPHLLFY